MVDLKQDFTYGATVVLKGGKCETADPRYGNRTHSQITDLNPGTRGVVVGVTERVLEVQITHNPSGKQTGYPVGKVFLSHPNFWHIA